MRKAVILFDEKTIINFPFVLSLCKRYKFLLILFPLATLTTIFYYKKTQHTVHALDVQLSTNVRTSTGDQAANPMASFFGPSQNYLSRNDLLAIIRSYEFLDLIAQKIYLQPKFKELNFNSVYAKKISSFEEIFNGCSDQNCYVQRLRGIVQNFFAIDNGVADFRFILKVNTLDSQTTRILTEVFVQSAEEYRTKFLKSDIEKQISAFKQLMEKGRLEIKEKGGEGIVERKESIDAKISDLKDRMRANSAALATEKRYIDGLEIQLRQGQELLYRNLDIGNRKAYDGYQILRKNLTDVLKGMSAILSVPESMRSDGDKEILREMELRENSLRQELSLYKQFKKDVVGTENLMDGRENSNPSMEFDYQVAKRRYKKLEEEMSRLENELVKDIDLKVATERIIAKVGPDIESLRQLEIKIVGLKLLATTIVSDIAFEKYEPNPFSFARTSLGQITTFSVMLNMIIFIILNIVFFLFDDRVHSDIELKSYFKEFDIIGVTPDFE